MNLHCTPRETEVIELLSVGFSQKEIAERIGCSINTVDSHIKHIKEKTGLQKATEITVAYYYKRYGLPLMNLPERVRKIIAAALVVLSMFMAVLDITDFLRVLRSPNRTVRTASRKPGARSTRTGKDYFLNCA